MQLKHIIILQNKIDLIDEAKATNQHDAIQVDLHVCYSTTPSGTLIQHLWTCCIVLYHLDGK